MIPVNKFQTLLTDELLKSLNPEVKDNLIDAITNIEFIARLISPERKYAKDLERDKKGRIIVDILNPHILEDMEYFRPTGNYYRKHKQVTHLRPNGNPNSEFGIWFRREIWRCWNGMVRPSDGEWITGDMYFYLNYTPIIQTKILEGTNQGDRIVDFPEIWEGVYWWFHYLELGRRGGIYNDFKGGNHGVEIAKRGAPHPYSTKALTVDGWKKWKEITVGDCVYSPEGLPTLVVDDIPLGKLPIYKFTFKDGREVLSAEDHIWEVYKNTSKGYKEKHTLSTKELSEHYYYNRLITSKNTIDKEYIYSVKKSNCILFPELPTKIDPYTFGLLLGDGTFRLPKHRNIIHYTSAEEDMEVYKKIVPYNIVKRNPKFSYTLEIKNIQGILKEYSLYMCKSEGKFIPDEYLYNTEEVRLNILKGLMDSDGTVVKTCPSFTTVSEKLKDTFLILVRSLGINASCKVRKSFYNKTLYKDAYTITLYTDKNVFNLSRKIGKLLEKVSRILKSKIDYTSIINIEYSHEEEAKCITVTDENSLYLVEDFIPTHNSKSYTCAAILAKLFLLGENERSNKSVRGVITAYDKEKLVKDGTLNKFIDVMDFCVANTQFPGQKTKDSLNEMYWISGYKDVNTGVSKGDGNETIGVTAKDNVEKARGKRSNKFIYEEFGAFKKFIDIWMVNKRSVEEGGTIFGLAIAIGTGGSEGSDFSGALEIIYNPVGYNVYALPNVYDKNSMGKQKTVFFFGAYINRKSSRNLFTPDGVSDVIGSLIEIFEDRHRIKYNSTDPLSLTRAIAEDPITILEAIMKRESTIYPVSDLNDRDNELSVNPRILDEVAVGEITLEAGKCSFKPNRDLHPIRKFPHKENTNMIGCIEIFSMPQISKDGKVYNNRYIAGIDPYDDDHSLTTSLGSIQILDLWTDEIVAEYTGRPTFANDFYENCRRLLLFYDARANYENDKKGLYTYFSLHNCTYLLTDNLEFLSDKDSSLKNYGNKAKGTKALALVKSYGRRCYRDYLMTGVEVVTQTPEGEVSSTIPRTKTLKSLALIKETALWNPDGNFDRHDAIIMLMLLREDRLRLLGDRSPQLATTEDYTDEFINDDFFKRNYKDSSTETLNEINRFLRRRRQ